MTSRQLEQDQHWMRLALAQAQQAAQCGEVPVGAVVVRDNVCIAQAHNEPIARHDPTAHAEINAMRQAGAVLGNYRLEDCTLYVTLEPCTMCSGALLQARFKRVVYGASEPRTGAAGSVLNVFEVPALHAQTAVVGGVLADECAQLMTDFFESKRHHPDPLRDDALRTNPARFEGLPDYPWASRYVSDLPALNGLRMHYLDEGATDAALTFVCLHTSPAWSYVYRQMIPVFLAAGHRVVAPDLIGFGKSDKPKKHTLHRLDWHRQVLLEWLERLDVQRVVLVVHGWSGLLGLSLPLAQPQRYIGLLAMDTSWGTPALAQQPSWLAWQMWCEQHPKASVRQQFQQAQLHGLTAKSSLKAYEAPFVDAGYLTGTRAVAQWLSQLQDPSEATRSIQVQQFWQTQWQGATFAVTGQDDPFFTESVMQAWLAGVRGPKQWMQCPSAGQWLPERGAPIAQAALNFFEKNTSKGV